MKLGLKLNQIIVILVVLAIFVGANSWAVLPGAKMDSRQWVLFLTLLSIFSIFYLVFMVLILRERNNWNRKHNR